jgi:hypothetical protein
MIACRCGCWSVVLILALPATSILAAEAPPLTANRAAFDQWQKSLDAALAGQPAETIVATPALRTALAQSELVRLCGPDKLWDVIARKGGPQAVQALVADTAWLEAVLMAGSGDMAQAVENLRLLYRHCTGWENPVVRRMGTALALQAGNWNRYRLVERFNHLQKAWREGLLHAKFDGLDLREMRYAVYTPGTDADYQFLLDDRQLKQGDYLGACWAINYVDPNSYGFSVQGWGYVDPWCHALGNGMGNRPLVLQRQVGGVCGTLSCYGSSCAQAHGVMSTCVGQPGHCAYVVRLGTNWPIGNDVFGPWSTGFSLYEGTSYMTSDHLEELVEADREHRQHAIRLTWVAHAQRAKQAPADPKQAAAPPAWLATYEQAIAAQPLGYPVWLEYIKALEGIPTTPAETWLKLARRAAQTFSEHQEAAWALALRSLSHAAAKLKPAERAALLVECHQQLSQKTAPKMYGYPMLGGFLNQQADMIGEPAAQLDFFGKLLALHYSADPKVNWIYGVVMGWGGERFARNPATAAGYAKMLGGFFAAQGSTLDKNAKQSAIAGGIRAATESGDSNLCRQWELLAATLLPAPAVADVHLNPQQAAARPKIEAPAGTLLSQHALLQTSSSAGGADRPLTYRQVLDGGPAGYFDTNGEARPWAQVQLAGDAELSGIVLVDRYEYAPEYPWDVPLVVSISADGKAWQQVAKFEKPQMVYRVDLQTTKPHARYVRIERVSADPAKPNTGRFHFRNFLVYGRKLY